MRNMQMTKREIREEIKRKRAAMSVEEWRMKSHQVCERIWNLRSYQKADVVYAYLGTKGEVLLDELIEDAWRQGKRVAVPKVVGTGLRFEELTDFAEVKVSHLGIREPIDGQTLRGGRPLFLMPAVAVDMKLHRIGRGGGHYDRYLEQNPMPVKYAAVFEYQIYPSVPTEPFDILADGAVTEERIIG